MKIYGNIPLKYFYYKKHCICYGILFIHNEDVERKNLLILTNWEI